jgi:hypothetical protein
MNHSMGSGLRADDSKHVIMMSLVVVVHLRECSHIAPVWDWMADAASDIQRNWFMRPHWQPTAKRENYMTDFELRSLSVRCPLCNAKPQSLCINTETQDANKVPHVARLEAYERQAAQ